MIENDSLMVHVDYITKKKWGVTNPYRLARIYPKTFFDNLHHYTAAVTCTLATAHV